MDQTSQESLDLHRAHGGKLEVKSKVPLGSRRDLSLAYTPGVGAVSVEIGRDPTKAYEYTIKKNTVAIVSDGSAILGLGNLGAAAAIPVMEGKAAIFKEFAGVDAFPICLDTQDTEEIIRITKAIAPVFGGINLEDISAPRCFEILARLQDELDIPVVHDDQQGTSVVVLAGLINALRVRGLKKEDVRIVINGAGAAGICVTRMLLRYGFRNITLCDSVGIIHRGREGLTDAKREMAEVTNHEGRTGGLAEALRGADIFIGVSKAGVLSGAMVHTMAPRPIIFALANPVPEIMPDEAKAAGAAIVATGRSDFPNQVNNALAFPGIFRGALDHRVRRVTDEMLARAAENLAGCVREPTADRILPDAFDRTVVAAVASAIR